MIGSVTVVGASLAGLSTVRALRSRGYDGRVVVVGAEHHAPYDRPPLSKAFLAGTATEADLALLDQDDAGLGVEWRLGVPAIGLDAAEHAVSLADGSVVRDDAVALRDDLAAGGRLVVVGGGFIGAEVASTARARGLVVTVVEAMPTPLAGPLGTEMGAVCGSLHADHGVRLRGPRRVRPRAVREHGLHRGRRSTGRAHRRQHGGLPAGLAGRVAGHRDAARGLRDPPPGRGVDVTARVEHLVTSGTSSLDGSTFEVEHDVWLLCDDEVLVGDPLGAR